MSAGRSEGSEALSDVSKVPMGGNYKRGRLFSLVPTDGTTGRGHKRKHVMLHLNPRKYCLRVIKCGTGLPREVVESPPEGSPAGHGPGQPAFGDLLQQGAWTRGRGFHPVYL